MWLCAFLSVVNVVTRGPVPPWRTLWTCECCLWPQLSVCAVVSCVWEAHKIRWRSWVLCGTPHVCMHARVPSSKQSPSSPNPASPDSPDARPGAWPPRGLPAVCKCRHLPGGRAPPPRAAAGPPVWAQEGVRGKRAGNESSGTRGPPLHPR